jgi:HAD superfamily hydrolase (TIGR01509 family)
MSFRLQAALFDFDGVVIDSSRAHERSWELLSLEYQKPLPEDHFKRGFGKLNSYIIPEILAWTHDAEEIRTIGLRKEELYREVIDRDGIDPLPGVIALLQALKQAGIPTAIGTSTERANVEKVLDQIGARSLFDHAITADDVSKGKPDPEVFLKGALACGATPGNCVVFEDAVYGIQAALAGGMKAVALTTTHPKSSFTGMAHAIVRDLSKVTLPMLRGLFNGQ